MVRNRLFFFTVVRRDVALAQNVLATRDKVDSYRDQIFRELSLHDGRFQPRRSHATLELHSCAKNRAHRRARTNRAEGPVIYLVQGQDIRHPIRRTAGEAFSTSHTVKTAGKRKC